MYTTLARIAHMYYEQGMTQQEIANETTLSRIRVSRMLQQARAEGVVRISISYDGYYPHLEHKLGNRYPNVEFIVSDALDGTPGSIKRSIGAATADYLRKSLHDGESIAVGWGTTLREVGECLDARFSGTTTFIPLLGGQVHIGLDVHANSIAELLASKVGGESLRIFAPAVAESAEAREMFVSSAAVQATLSRAAASDHALFSLGAPFTASATIEQVGYYTPEDIESLRATGAACDVISISYFDAAGNNVNTNLTERTVSITEAELRAIPHKICVAGGEDKHEAIRIALDLGVVDVLITDELTAKALT